MTDPEKRGPIKSFQEMGEAMGRGGTQEKKCRQCGAPVQNPRFSLCSNCYNKPSGANPRPHDSESPLGLPNNYLSEGYFDTTGGESILRDNLIVTDALAIGRLFYRIELTSAQLRRFYGHVRQIEKRLESGESFASVRPAILELKPHVANTVGRAREANNKDYRLFKEFIDRNVDLAEKGKDQFLKGFLLHFQYVLAYFTYLKPKDRN